MIFIIKAISQFALASELRISQRDGQLGMEQNQESASHNRRTARSMTLLSLSQSGLSPNGYGTIQHIYDTVELGRVSLSQAYICDVIIYLPYQLPQTTQAQQHLFIPVIYTCKFKGEGGEVYICMGPSVQVFIYMMATL